MLSLADALFVEFDDLPFMTVADAIIAAHLELRTVFGERARPEEVVEQARRTLRRGRAHPADVRSP